MISVRYWLRASSVNSWMFSCRKLGSSAARRCRWSTSAGELSEFNFIEQPVFVMVDVVDTSQSLFDFADSLPLATVIADTERVVVAGDEHLLVSGQRVSGVLQMHAELFAGQPGPQGRSKAGGLHVAQAASFAQGHAQVAHTWLNSLASGNSYTRRLRPADQAAVAYRPWNPL